MTNASPVLCVDLDGALVRTNTLVESLFLFARLYPLRIPLLLIWSLRGRSRLEMRIAEAALPSIETLPYNTELLEYLRQQKSAGVKLVLAAGADGRIASRVAAHLALFDEVWASDGGGSLAEKYPGCEYIGKSASTASSHPFRISVWLRALRAHQWVKNLLIFFPLLTSHRLTDWPVLALAAIGFLACSLAASGTYLINDLFDLEADRAHPGKCRRPFAAGLLNPAAGVVAALALWIAAFAAALPLNRDARLLLAGYIVLTLAYSLHLKRWMVVDVLLLVCLYLLRIFLGGIATGITISVWLLAFSMFFFLALALVKRLTELRALERASAGGWETSAGGYQASDVEILGSLAASSAYLSVVLFALYINSPEVRLLYRQPQLLWPLCLVIIYWLSRMLLMANRGQLHDDPIVFATHDRASWIAGIAVLLILYVAK
jgi:4-hydroxybenzoate polyprenyltransferase